MNSYVIYIIKVCIGISLFVIPYYFFLRNDGNLNLKRFFLLGGVILSFVFPFIGLKSPEINMIYIQPEEIPLPDLVMMPAEEPASPVINWTTVILAVYLCGMLILLFRNIFLVLKWNAVWNRSPRREGKIVYSGHDEVFAFFSRIFLPVRLENSEDSESILLHEKAHIRQFHFVDLLVLELTLLLTWFNPFTWLLMVLVKENHEHLADREVLSRGIDPTDYRARLLNQVLGGQVFSLAQQFNSSLTRKRFDMMKRSGSFRSGLIKMLVMVPAILVSLGFAVAKEKKADTISGMVVLADSGKPAEGAIAIIKGTTSGATVGKDGSYKLELKEKATVVFSYVGYKTQAWEFEPGDYRFISLDRDVIEVDEAGPGKDKQKIEIRKVIIIDGNEGTMDDLSDLDSKDVESVRVYDRDHMKGGDDLIIVKTKKNIDTTVNDYDDKTVTALAITDRKGDSARTVIALEDIRVIGYGNKSDTIKISNDPLVLIDGKEGHLSDISPDEIEKISVMKKSSASTVFGVRGANGVILISTKKGANARLDTIKDGAFRVVEEPPKFNGGDPAKEFRKYIADNMKYPQEAAKKGIEGRVIVQFVVDENGKVSDARVLQGVDPLLDNEALRVINSSPAWTPGKQKGKAVKVFYTFPIDFSIFTDTRIKVQPDSIRKNRIITVNGKPAYRSVDEPPRFNGGSATIEFTKFIGENLRYPKEAAEKGIQGTVMVQFVVTSEGKIRDARVVREINPLLKNEALRVVNSSPDWTPGRNNGEAVDVVFNFPLNFSLNGNKASQEVVFTIVEEMPKFNGGDPTVEFRKYISENMKYPKEAADKKIQGRVVVQFVVDTSGYVVSPVIAVSVDPLIDKEAIRVVTSSPKWTPGKQRGKLVKVFYTFPINFVLD